MNRIKKILLALLIVFVAIQFIQPARNTSKQLLRTDFIKVYAVPANVQSVIQNACYDCHSNNTIYPWYVNIQPMGWIMKGHIDDGKAKLNFSEFGSYKNRRQLSKLKEILNQNKEGEMPQKCKSYQRRKDFTNGLDEQNSRQSFIKQLKSLT